VDHHFVRAAVAAGVEYRDRTAVTAELLKTLGAEFVVDASGPGGFLARQLGIPSALYRMHTRAGLLFSHFDRVRLFAEVVPGLPAGPYPDDWAAVHHLIDEGWMYSLRFDHGVTSAGFLLRERVPGTPEQMWRHLLRRYPTIGALFCDAQPLMPLAFKPRIQHRLTRAAGKGWAMLPHAFAFVDPLFSTGIAWSLRAIERLAGCFENGGPPPPTDRLARYDALLSREADRSTGWWRAPTARWRGLILRRALDDLLCRRFLCGDSPAGPSRRESRLVRISGSRGCCLGRVAARQPAPARTCPRSRGPA
jgi:FADH2 O2-dependent halogenase